jgi:hypothetical protein
MFTRDIGISGDLKPAAHDAAKIRRRRASKRQMRSWCSPAQAEAGRDPQSDRDLTLSSVKGYESGACKVKKE